MDRLPSSSFPPHELREWWKKLFEGDLKSVKAYGIHGEVAESPFRSVCWKIYFGILPDDDIGKWEEAMNERRRSYETLREMHIIDPSQVPSDLDLSRNNPLSLDDENPWKIYFENAELEKVILQDVDRTFPEQDFFREPKNQRKINDILFVWAKENDDISYRQGMHELLALIFFVVSMDQIPAQQGASNQEEAQIDSLMHHVLSPSYVEHDSYGIFSKLMEVTKTWFESNQKSGEAEINRRRPDPTKPFGKGDDSQPESQSEVVRKCTRLHHVLLKESDPALYNHLNKLGIEPQIYGLRWIRLLFGREFHVADVLKMWDAIFADDPRLGSVDYVCLAMLLYLRENLLRSDFTGCLGRLMKYPPVENALWIFERAIKIRDSPKNLKPIPVNAPPSSFDSPLSSQSLSSSSSSSSSSSPSSSSTSFFIAPAPGSSTVHRQAEKNNAFRKAAAAIEKKVSTPPAQPKKRPVEDADSFGEGSGLVDKVRELQLQLNHLHQMNMLLSDQMQKGISILHHELLRDDKQPDIDTVELAMAGLKQVKDILSGDLPCDPAILMINDTAFSPPETVQGEASGEEGGEPRDEKDIEQQERKQREERERAEHERREEERRAQEERRAEEEKRRQRLERERKQAEEEERRRREEEDRRTRAKIPPNLFDEDPDDDIFNFNSKGKQTASRAGGDKLNALLE